MGTSCSAQRAGGYDKRPGQNDAEDIPNIPASRIAVVGTLPETPYNLHVIEPQADPVNHKHAVEFAIAGGAGIKIEHRNVEV